MEVHSFLGLKLLMTPLLHVSGMLVDVLDPQLPGCPKQHRIPVPDELNTFRGILDWKKKDDPILAPTIYSKTEGVKRKITTVEMAQVMDFSVCLTERMKGTNVRLLIEGDVQGKVIQGAIHFLARWNLRIKTLRR